MSKKELKTKTGLTSRELKRAIEKEREAGCPICCCKTGYYLADLETESGYFDCINNINHLRRVGHHTLKEAAALEKILLQHYAEGESAEGESEND